MTAKKTMLIEHDPQQTRIALLEDDSLVELYLENPDDQGFVGNIYKGKVNRVLPGMQAAFVDIGLERDAFLYAGEVIDPQSTVDGSTMRANPLPIATLVRPGQELILQVLKDPLPNKGARVSTQITLPGRYLVLLPGTNDLGVSRRIEAPEERERLYAEIAALQPPECGLILRTAALGCDRAELERDLEILLARWQRIAERASKMRAPSRIHRDLDLAERIVRDQLSADFAVIRVSGEETFTRIRDFVTEIEPDLVGVVKRDAYDTALFERYGIDRAVNAALESEVALRSGGSIVIETTEALVAIDVNTGRYVGRTTLEDTVLQTNLEAVVEVARQIRLRNLGGIIVVDLIDMEDEAHREQVVEAFQAELARDRSRVKTLPISEFGLLQLTRKRSRTSLERQLSRTCRVCRGRGRVRNPAWVCLEIRRRMTLEAERLEGRDVVLRVHPEVAVELQGPESSLLDELGRSLGSEILLESDSHCHPEQFEILGSP